jgi:hypothetical protein
VRLRAALALLFLAGPAISRAAHGRLSFSLLAGGGYASDVFVGAGLGPSAVVQVIPSTRLDLSLAPQWKLAAFADFSYGHYVSSGFTSLAESATLEGRFVPNTTWDASLALGGENASYSLGSPLDQSTGTGPTVFSTTAARASQLLRLRALGFEWRAAGLAAARISTATGGDIPEHDLAALGGVMHPLGEDASFTVTYKLAHTNSTSPDFTLTSQAIFALLFWRVGEIDLLLQLQLQSTGFANQAHEDFERLTLSATHPLSQSVDVEVTYSFAASQSDDASRPPGRRHLAFLALRWRLAEVNW